MDFFKAQLRKRNSLPTGLTHWVGTSKHCHRPFFFSKLRVIGAWLLSETCTGHLFEALAGPAPWAEPVLFSGSANTASRTPKNVHLRRQPHQSSFERSPLLSHFLDPVNKCLKEDSHVVSGPPEKRKQPCLPASYTSSSNSDTWKKFEEPRFPSSTRGCAYDKNTILLSVLFLPRESWQRVALLWWWLPY